MYTFSGITALGVRTTAQKGFAVRGERGWPQLSIQQKQDLLGWGSNEWKIEKAVRVWEKLKVCFVEGKPGCSDVTWRAVETEPSNIGGDHSSRVEDSGLADSRILGKATLYRRGAGSQGQLSPRGAQ